MNLEVGSGSHVHQTAEIMSRFEPVVTERRPDLVLVIPGYQVDPSPALACADSSRFVRAHQSRNRSDVTLLRKIKVRADRYASCELLIDEPGTQCKSGLHADSTRRRKTGGHRSLGGG